LNDKSLRSEFDTSTTRMVPEAVKGPRMLTSEDEMRTIFADVVSRAIEKSTPNPDDIARYRGPRTDAGYTAGHRKHVSRGDFPVGNWTGGKVTPRQFATAVAVQLSQDIGIGSDIEAKAREQFTGRWVPVAFDCWFQDVPRMDRVGTLQAQLPEDVYAEGKDAIDMLQHVPVPVRALCWVIEFRDAKNEKPIRYEQGQPRNAQELVSTTDPALLAVLKELAESNRAARGEEEGAKADPLAVFAEKEKALAAKLAEIEAREKALAAAEEAATRPVPPKGKAS
jgi:hypothetical protein